MPDFFLTQQLIADFEPSFTPAVFAHRLLIAGLGGNGTHLALGAVRMGFAEVAGIDCDVVSESNLSRQVLYTRDDVGRRKAAVAREALERHNLHSRLRTHDFDILRERARFGGLVAAADLVFVVLDQPGATLFALDACYQLGRPAVTGGTCVMSGLMTRVGWMAPGQRPCLNCALPLHPSQAPWAEFYKYDGGAAKDRTPEVARLDEEMTLPGGHPSTYPTACIGSSLMLALAVSYLMGRRDMPRLLELSVLSLAVEQRPLRRRPSCPTCSADLPATQESSGGSSVSETRPTPPHDAGGGGSSLRTAFGLL